MKLTEILKSIQIEQPYLYHATYKPLLKKIKEKGLDTSDSRKAWDDSIPGYVYLAKDPDVAASYAESSEMVSDTWLDQIIVLTIDATQLDKDKLFIDQNVQDNEGDTIEYRGIIPFSSIVKVEEYF
jgi:RNA:NAD 2'-phosphotransferase (TPT1/KptA family)